MTPWGKYPNYRDIARFEYGRLLWKNPEARRRLLKHLRADYAKIDGSLMQGLANNQENQAWVTALVLALKEKDIHSIAERVEDANTMAVLWQCGVQYMQGYYVQEPEVILGTSTL